MRTRFLTSSLIFCVLGVGVEAIAQFQNDGADAAAQRPYYFSGPCTSQGSWTAAALAQTQKLREITQQLRDNPDCRSLSTSVQLSLANIDKATANAADSPERATRLADLPQEISALRGFATSPGSDKKDVMRLLMGKTVQQAMEVASVAKANPLVATGAAVMSMGLRVQAAAHTSLSLFNGVIDSLPRLQNCLIEPNDAGQLFAASTKVLASFASSGQDSMGNQLAEAVSKLASYRREKRFADAIMKLNDTDLMTSTACLLEVTSESYCSARDGQMLFNKMMHDYAGNGSTAGGGSANPSPSPSGVRPVAADVTNPLTGYYVLTQQMPVISSWIQQVQIGVTPKLPTDADFLANVLNDVNNFYVTLKALQGSFNAQSETIRSLPDIDAKQNALVVMLKGLQDQIAPSMNITSTGKPITNFFMYRAQTYEVIFKLIGMPVPDDVRPQKGFTPSPGDWLASHYKEIPGFGKPEEMLPMIGNNLNTLINDANSAAMAYYNRFFIVDQVELVNRSLIGHTYNVRDSFIAVDQYLNLLEKKIRRYSSDLTMIASIRETQSKIHRVLKRYEEVRLASEKISEEVQGDLTDEQIRTFFVLNVALIDEVYTQFEVRLAKTGWLANRLVDFVNTDFNLMLKARVDFSPYYQELYTATGQLMMDRMLQMASGNPATVQEDLAMALRVNKANIEELEALLKDRLIGTAAYIKMVSENKRPGPAEVRAESRSRMFHDQASKIPGADHSRFTRLFHGIANYLNEFAMNSDRYPQPGFFGASGSEQRTSPDDEYGSSKKVLSQLCVQSLAFNDLRGFWPICKQVQLASPYANTANPELSVSYVAKAYENLSNPGLNHSGRICAFRDFNRKNLVVYLTQANGVTPGMSGQQVRDGK